MTTTDLDLTSSGPLLVDVSDADNGSTSEWFERGLCAQTDPEVFYPKAGDGGREAKRVCLGCEVRAECLEYALAHDERFGVWGGMTAPARRKLKRRTT